MVVAGEDYYHFDSEPTSWYNRYYDAGNYNDASNNVSDKGLKYRQKMKYLLGNPDSELTEMVSATPIYINEECTNKYWDLDNKYTDIKKIPDIVYTKNPDTGLGEAHKVVGIGKGTYLGANGNTENKVNGVTIYTITIPKYVEVIGDGAFNGHANSTDGDNNKKINSIIFNCENLKTIGQWSFQKTNVSKVTLPNTVETIGQKAFSDCSKLTCMVLPSGKLTLNADSLNFTSSNSLTIFQTKKVNDLTLNGRPATSDKTRIYVFPNITSAQAASSSWKTVLDSMGNNTTVYYKDNLTSAIVESIKSTVGSANISDEAKTILDNAVAGSGSPATGMLAVYNVPFITKQQFLF